ncbi:MAG: C1 family peptidase [Bacteroidaceae bacterium]|nr:C1 family peptidase [Bacteroidaceae bacterium]
MKLTRILPVAAALMLPVAAMAQTGITAEVLKQIEQQQTNTAADKAIRNALSHNAVATLATDIRNFTPVDGDFSDVVPTKGITDQKSSGRCWLFTGLNVLRSKAIMQHNLPGLELSQNYLFFYDQLEKSNLFLQGVIDTREKPMDDRTVDFFFGSPLSDGGTFCGVADLVKKYGVMPKEAMPDTYSAENTGQFLNHLKTKLREYGLELRDMGAKKATDKQLQARKVEMLATIYRMLTLGLGVPPTEFTWTQKSADGKVVSTEKYTPMAFYNKYFGGEDMYANTVLLMNDPMREYYKVYQIEYDRHTYDGHDWLYLNLPNEEIKPMLISSIKDKTAMYISCDVGKFCDRKKGTLDLANFDYESLFGTTFGMDKKQRVLTHASGSSHAMTLIAVDIDPATQKTKKWMVENSWGAASGYQGKLIMTDEWFDNYMFRFCVNKKYVPAKYQDMLKQKPIMLPAWDPMFLGEE